MNVGLKFLAIGIVSFFVVGCASIRPTVQVPEKRELGREFASPIPVSIEPQAERADTAFSVADSGDVLTLRQALQLALLNNPALQGFSYEVRIREAQALQASLLPNPEVGLEVENIGGQGDVRGLRAAETTLQFSQLIELGGKRQKRTRVAELEGNLAGWDFEARRLDVYAATVEAYVAVVAAQERVRLSRELVALAESFLKNIYERVEKGKDSPAEAARAEVELANATVELQAAEKALQSARQQLAALWGSTRLKFQRVSGKLDTVVALPPLDNLVDYVVKNPDIARWAAEKQLADARLASEKAQRIPDPVVSGGIRRLNEIESNAFVMGISVPLLVFNRNQGNIRAAELQRLQVERFQEAALIAVRSNLVTLYNQLTAVRDEIQIIRTQSLPRAEEAFRIIREGYLSGRFGFLDVLDAQRTLFDVRSRYVDALAEFHTLVAQIERLTAHRIDGFF